jgi:hypothetical protein
MGVRKYDAATIADAVDRRDRGQGWRTISDATGMSIGAAQYYCLAHGVIPLAAIALAPTRTLVVRRGDHLVRLFTPAEDARIEALRIEGETIAAIGRAIGRRPGSVRTRLQALARRAEAALDAA